MVVTALALVVASLARPPLLIEDDPRLAGTCTVWETAVGLRDLLRRFQLANHVELKFACPFRDQLVTVFVDAKPAGKVLSLIANCLDLDWRRSGNGYELYLPAYVKRMEHSCEDEMTQATVHAWHRKLTDLRKPASALQPEPPVQRSADPERLKEAAERRRTLQAEDDLLRWFARSAAPESLASLERGETVIAATIRCPGLLFLADPRPASVAQGGDKPDALFMALQLDPHSGGIRYGTWLGNGSTGRTPAGLAGLLEDPVWPEHPAFGQTSLGRRVAAWGKPISRTAQPFQEDGKLKPAWYLPEISSDAIPPSVAVAERLARVGGLDVIMPTPPKMVAPLFPFLPDSASIAWGELSRNVATGFFRFEDGAILVRPLGYWCRNEVWAAQSGEADTAEGSPSISATIKAFAARRNSWCLEPSWERFEDILPWRPARALCPETLRFFASLSPAQGRKAVQRVDGIDGFFDRRQTVARADVPGIAYASLTGAQQALAREALLAQCLDGWIERPQSLEQWREVLDPRNLPRLRFWVSAARDDACNVYIDRRNQGTYFHLLRPADWRRAIYQSAGSRLFAWRVWRVRFSFGMPGGPCIGVQGTQDVLLCEASADETRTHPDLVLKRILGRTGEGKR